MAIKGLISITPVICDIPSDSFGDSGSSIWKISGAATTSLSIENAVQVILYSDDRDI